MIYKIQCMRVCITNGVRIVMALYIKDLSFFASIASNGEIKA